MANVDFVELFRGTVQTLEDLLGGPEPNTQIYTEQCTAMVHGFVQVRNNLPTLLVAANGVCLAQIFKELYCLACGAVRILNMCCEEQTWLQAVILLKVHTSDDSKWSVFETLRDELDWCINIFRGNIGASTSTGTQVNRLTHRDRERKDRKKLRKKLRNVVGSGTLQEVAIANFRLPRLNVSDGQPQDQETLPLIHLIEGPVVGTRVCLEIGKISAVSRNLTWFRIDVVEKRFDTGDDVRNLWENEAHIMATLNHPNVVTFIGCSDGEGGPAIIMKCEEQSLQDYITADLPQQNNRDVQTPAEMRPRPRPILDLLVAVDLLTQIASGMAYLHSQDVAHVDLNPANLLITSHTAHKFLHVKIADFGQSIRLKESGKILNRWGKNLGTTLYRAPELFLENNWVCFKAADVCSFGFTAWAILHCHEPKLENVPRNHHPFYYNALFAGKRLGFDDDIPVEFQKLITYCWDTNPDKRPPFSEIYLVLQSLKEEWLGSHVPLVQWQQRPRRGLR